VEDLQSQNDYQLRLKDLNHSERLKEVSDKFSAELEADKRNYELLLQAKNDLELEYEDKLRQLETRHDSGIQSTESTYQVCASARARARDVSLCVCSAARPCARSRRARGRAGVRGAARGVRPTGPTRGRALGASAACGPPPPPPP
jgi:hypothetical protein